MDLENIMPRGLTQRKIKLYDTTYMCDLKDNRCMYMQNRSRLIENKLVLTKGERKVEETNLGYRIKRYKPLYIK